MDFKIRESYAVVDGKIYIDTVEDRQRLLNDCGEEFYNHVLSLWDTIEDKLTYDEILVELKQEKEFELNDKFTERVKGSFTTTEGYTMQFNTDDSLKMQGAITLMETTGQTEGYLTQADDTTIYHVPLETMKAVLVEMLAAYAQCHARKQELRSQINEAQNVEELSAFEITWPV